MPERSDCVTLGLNPSFGFGDRIGLATPGHVAAMKRSGSGIEPIFPQQSIREMARTGRTPRQVMDDAYFGARKAGWLDHIGADADHLKTPNDVDATAAVGFTFFTIDPSDHVDAHADDYDEPTLRDKFAEVADEVEWLDKYQGKSIGLATGTTVELDEQSCLRAAVKYGRAINHALKLADHIKAVNERAEQDYEIELSVDETEQPTTLAEHYIIADQCVSRGMKLVSLAPRYIGDFEKGVDYKGDLKELEKSLRDHAAIAELLGPYKLSLHSGSDKLSMYPALARGNEGNVPRQDGGHELPGGAPGGRALAMSRCSVGSSTLPGDDTKPTRLRTTSRPPCTRPHRLATSSTGPNWSGSTSSAGLTCRWERGSPRRVVRSSIARSARPCSTPTSARP